MLKNFITVAYRTIVRQLSYTLINILGLAVGIACSLVIFLYVYGEWRHDRDFKDADRIYRIGVSFFNVGNFASGPDLLLDYLPQEFDGIEVATRLYSSREERIRVGNETYFERNVNFADSLFFQVFSYDFASGDARLALHDPNTAVVREQVAEKYFPGKNPVGETIFVGKEQEPYTITAVVKDDDRLSHITATIWLSKQRQPGAEKEYWTSASSHNYVKLKKGFTEQDLRAALDRIIANQVFPSSGWTSLEEFVNNENSVKFSIYALTDIYLKSKLTLELSPGGNETNMKVFAGVSAFILFLAAVNFINLTTARATRRAKEVGIRKSLGTSRSMLVIQFLFESVSMSWIAMLIALGLAELFILAFYWITGQQLVVDVWSNGLNVLRALAFATGVGVMAGIYPAFYLAAFKPLQVLKGKLTGSHSTFRNALVIFQFVVSVSLIVSTVIILRQLSYMRNKDLGFDQRNVFSIDNAYLLDPSARAFCEELARHKEVLDYTLHGGEPANKALMSFYTYKTPEMESEITIHTYFGDASFLNVMGFQLLKGRDFNKDSKADTASVILNESAVRALGLTGDPIGATVNTNMHVIGVVHDFHWESLRTTIAPLAILFTNPSVVSNSESQAAFKLNGTDIPSFIAYAEQTWKKFAPDEPFKYHFLDDNFGEMLRKEQVFGKALLFFTGLAIFISCLGLLGLSAFTAEQRTKEIGIRKVLGASAARITVMLNRQFSTLVLIAILLAVPLTYFAIGWWLESFAYHIQPGVGDFVAGALVAIVIAWATVSYHAIRASQSNPVDVLRTE